MNDIIPPKPNTRTQSASHPAAMTSRSANAAPTPAPTSQNDERQVSPPPPHRRRGKKIALILAACILIIGVIAALAGYFWYSEQLKPLNSKDTTRHQVEIAPGMTARSVATMLEDKKMIRSADAFYIYTYIHKQRNNIEAGVYSVAPADGVPEVVKRLVSGDVEQFSVTFYPGSTLTDLRTNPSAKASDVTSMLIDAGYTKADVAAALQKSYSSPVFDGKPSGSTLEGYLYGDTYTFATNAPASQVVERSIAELNAVVTKNNLAEQYKKQGLTLYEGITLASIIQREVTKPQDEKVVAQIFLKRLKEGTQLGSDVTYQYAAAKMGVDPTPELNSPYNTRKFTGLPPGPISNPGLGALIAVAQPASTNYTYFLSGDDDVTYYADTAAQHEANIRDHCKKKCSVY